MNNTPKFVLDFTRAFKESTLVRAIATLIISIFLGYYFYTNGGDVNQGELLDLELVITLVLVEVPLIMFTPIIGKLIFNEYQKKLEETRRIEKKHNSKKLNDSVFRKLTHVLCLEYYPFFENKFGFCIRKNPKFLTELDSASIAFNIQLNKLDNANEYFDKLDDVITTLEIGEEYLQQNYTSIFNEWMKIKHELDKMNKDQEDFCNKVSEKIMNRLKKHFQINPTLRLIPFEDEKNWAYFSDNVPRMISLLFNKFGYIDFTTDTPIKNQFYVNFLGYRILGFNKEEMLDLRLIKDIFRNATIDEKLREEHHDFSLRLIALNNKIDAFCQQLEKRVVNDIDNQI